MFLFRFKRTLKLGIKSLWMHKLRSTLTTLGIIFGVSSVIAMLAIGEGASREAEEKIAQLGSKNIIIETVKPPEDDSTTGQQQTMIEYGLTYDDAERFQLVELAPLGANAEPIAHLVAGVVSKRGVQITMPIVLMRVSFPRRFPSARPIDTAARPSPRRSSPRGQAP